MAAARRRANWMEDADMHRAVPGTRRSAGLLCEGSALRHGAHAALNHVRGRHGPKEKCTNAYAPDGAGLASVSTRASTKDGLVNGCVDAMQV